MKKVHIVNHPLISDKIYRLRDKTTEPRTFRYLIREISTMLAVEATSHCLLSDAEVATPLEITTGKLIARDIVLVPILRAGLGMVEGFLNLVPGAKVGHLGLYRDEATLKPVTYYENLGFDLSQSEIFLLDPMLATGGSADYSLAHIKEHGGINLTLVTVISAPEGIELVNKNHPDVNIVTAVVDRELNEQGYILPGLGDAGDRLYGTQ